MASGNRIVASPAPLGRFEECIVVGTPKPGTVMEKIAATSPVAGTYSFEPAGTTAASGTHGMAADGDNIAIGVLVCFADHAACPPGKSATDAYATGERGAIYWPQNGDQLNMLFQNAAGTADDIVMGDKLIVDDGTGKLLKSTGTVESEPFIAAEAIVDPTADQLFLCEFIGA